MKLNRILISNDDGKFAIGSQLLIHLLKHKYQLVVAGPVDQKSSIGAAITTKGFEWEKEVKENVTYYNVKGTPSDAIELAYTQEQPFDLMISGINWGPNISSYLYRSGTYNAVTCAMGFGLVQKGIALS